MIDRLKPFLGDFALEPAASETSLDLMKKGLGYDLPDDYLRFLAEANGGEGFVGSAYLILWKAEELVAFNLDYEVEVYAPGLFLFSSDGGGEGFGFDTRSKPFKIVEVSVIGMGWDIAVVVADSFVEFIERMFYSDGTLL